MFTVSALNSSLQLFMVCTCIWSSSVECVDGSMTLVLKQLLKFSTGGGGLKGGWLVWVMHIHSVLRYGVEFPGLTPFQKHYSGHWIIRISYPPPCQLCISVHIHFGPGRTGRIRWILPESVRAVTWPPPRPEEGKPSPFQPHKKTSSHSFPYVTMQSWKHFALLIHSMSLWMVTCY